MKSRLIALAAAASVFVAAPAVVPVLEGSLVAPAPAVAKSCSSGKHGVIAGKHRCLRAQQRCAPSRDRQYHRYGFHCHKRYGSSKSRLIAFPPKGCEKTWAGTTSQGHPFSVRCSAGTVHIKMVASCGDYIGEFVLSRKLAGTGKATWWGFSGFSEVGIWGLDVEDGEISQGGGVFFRFSIGEYNRDKEDNCSDSGVVKFLTFKRPNRGRYR